MKNKPTQKELKRQLHYNPATGIFTRLIAKYGDVRVGDIAGCSFNGYIRINIDGKQYMAHCLAWLYMEGYWPEYEIDHKNGIRSDNKWLNLRHTTKSCNLQNQKVYKNNTSGFPGVVLRKGSKKWDSRITINKKRIQIGYFDDILEAALARFTFEMQCPLWTCNYRSELVKAIKAYWPEFKF